MNQQSIDLYAEHGIDLREPLECAVCAQHCNGGLRGNLWWETNIAHLFAIGELNGTHGVRPGGSALNSGQVGATRVADYIAHIYRQAPQPAQTFVSAVAGQVTTQVAEYTRYLAAGADALDLPAIRPAIQERMSREGAFVRSLAGCEEALAEAKELYAAILKRGIRCNGDRKLLARATEDKFLALSSVAFLTALRQYIVTGGGSRGGYMILDDNGDLTVDSRRGRELRHRSENQEKRQEIIEIRQRDDAPGEFDCQAVAVRPLPTDESWFETTWAAWNAGKIYPS
jgi:aspartate oxidase